MTDLYIGAPITHASERAVLERLLHLLAQDGRPAVIFANISLEARQIDLVVGMDDLALVIEAKGFTRPIRGGENGPWQVQVPSGDWKNFRTPTNPYVQARDAALTIRDAMQSFSGEEVPYPSAAVIFSPRIPRGSQVYAGDFKVSVRGLDGLDVVLRNRRKVTWLFDRWKSFAEHLGLSSVNSVVAACDEELTEAEALARQYSGAYSRAYTHPESIVPFSCRRGADAVWSDGVVSLVAERQADLLIQGPSGCGKSLLAGQAGHAFSQNGGIAITLPIKDYSGSIKAALNREVGLLCGATATTLLNAARRLNRPLLFIADGYNECAVPDRPSLTQGLAALARIYEASLLVTSQCPLARNDLLPLHIVEVPPAAAQTKITIARNVMGSDSLPYELELLLDAVDTGLEARLIGEAGQQLSAGSSQYALFDTFARKRLDDMASDGIRLLSKIAGWLSERVAFSLSVRDLDRLMDIDHEPHSIATRLRTAGLLVQRADRVSFAHEMFFHAFAAENVLRRAAGRSTEILKALASPQHADRKALIIGAIDDDTLRHQVLEGLTDAQSISACIIGTCGREAQEWARGRCKVLWERIRAEACGVSFRISDKGWMKVAFEDVTLAPWTASEHALLAAIPERIVGGHHLEEVLDTIAVLDQRIADEGLRLGDQARQRKVAVRSALFANAYVHQSNSAPGITQICTRLHGAFYRTASEAVSRTIDRMLERGDLSPGQVYFLLMLSRGANAAIPLIAHALKTHWAGAPYHLRLDLLDAARMCHSASDIERDALIAALERLLPPSNVFISSMILEALQALGALEDSEREHVATVHEEVRYCLSDPEDAKRCTMAYGLYSSQFDHPYSGAYYEVIASLPETERKSLLTMASNGARDTATFLVPLLTDLTIFGDSSVRDSMSRYTALPPTDSFMPQDAVAVFMIAHIALARLGCPLIEWQGEEVGPSAQALAACGTILYWCNVANLEESDKRQACKASLRVLLRHENGAALDVIRRCEHASVEGLSRLSGSAPMERSIVNTFPGETAEICRQALAGSFRQIGYFQHHFDYHRHRNLTFAIDVLARYGNSTDLRLLREYADDTALGTAVIAAVRAIEDRLARAYPF